MQSEWAPPGFLRRRTTLLQPRFRFSLKTAIAFLVVLCFSQSLLCMQNGPPPPTEAEITAAFIINFARFTDWPTQTFVNAFTPISVGVIGAEDVRVALDSFAGGKQLDGRRVEIHQIGSVNEARLCQVVYVGAAKGTLPSDLAKAAREASILTIGKTDDFLIHGGMIRLFVENAKMRFDVNLRATNLAKIRLSSRLLALAHSIVDLPEQGAH
jgi:hypothetical protein